MITYAQLVSSAGNTRSCLIKRSLISGSAVASELIAMGSKSVITPSCFEIERKKGNDDRKMGRNADARLNSATKAHKSEITFK